MSADQARASVSVALEQDEAFRVFTEEIDRWWRRGPKYRQLTDPDCGMFIEPRLGGRVFELDESRQPPLVIEVGRVTQWQPPQRFVTTWRLGNFAPHEATVVEVEFAPCSGGTLVTVTHRGWSALPAEHPARHGLASAAFARMIGLWWGEQLTAYRQAPSSAAMRRTE